MIRRRWFRAMGTDVELFVDSGPDGDAADGLEAGEQEIHRLERLLSRFCPDSQLSRLNRERSLDPGAELREVVELALIGRTTTGGRFDPTVHNAIVAAGYDRSFERIDRDTTSGDVLGPVSCGGGVELDHATGVIRLAPGVRLDLGGIAKGYAADRVSDLLSASGPCLVNVGGDLATRGVPDEGAWEVGVETAEGTISLSLERGAMATSGRDRRRWRRDGQEAHHVIDPRTGLPAQTDLVRVTVVASSAAEAEVLATGFLVSGADAAAGEAEALGVPCVLVPQTGATRFVGGLG
jgi:FAD:protein FMN transferase